MATLDEVKTAVTKLIQDIFGENELPELIINPSGTWTLGGPTADCGLTGRKIVCDQYGGYCAVGGGAFSGKDPTKVDRSASYMARHLACKLLDIYALKWCEVQLGYAIGIAEPVSVVVKNDKNLPLEDFVRENYDLTPLGIIEKLNLLDRDYEVLAEGCHYREAII
jgi:S-adenosylmethionine synthetase